MFKVELGSVILNTYFISDSDRSYMHRDGTILYDACEYWVGREAAQAVLDKFQPAHVWVHGDIFETSVCGNWIYLKPAGVPRVICLTNPDGDSDIGSIPDLHLRVATFLFNIKDKLDG